ncbi:MAG: hypothetical protein L6Q37_00345 [Bdellovibrionaceae bacterium]|nr:hypothetical protein [Pseudobdellovibrionaceae bacterium]NUM58875.1 hypothetical protein [Pseudobdellovibrionaceae bacterium]
MKKKISILFSILFFLTSISSTAQDKKSPVKVVNTPKSEDFKNENEKSDTKKSEVLLLETHQNESMFLNSLDYPELQVVPRASERLQMDGFREQDNGWFMFWPFHVASGATLLAALMHKNRFNPAKENDDDFRKYTDFKVNAAVGVSVSWFALTYFISAGQPYLTELNKINNIKGKDKKSSLLKERMAEEAMQKPAELIKMLTYLSTITNLVASGGLIDVVNSDYNLYAGVAMLAAFMPLIFKNKYVENYEKQMEYKRKIYTPVVYTDIYKPTQYSQWSPRLVVEWKF